MSTWTGTTSLIAMAATMALGLSACEKSVESQRTSQASTAEKSAGDSLELASVQGNPRPVIPVIADGVAGKRFKCARGVEIYQDYGCLFQLENPDTMGVTTPAISFNYRGDDSDKTSFLNPFGIFAGMGEGVRIGMLKELMSLAAPALEIGRESWRERV